MKTDGHVTIEKTAKKYKLALLLSGLCFFIGLIWAIAKVSTANGATPNIILPVILIVVSALAYITTKVIIWWNHG